MYYQDVMENLPLKGEGGGAGLVGHKALKLKYTIVTYLPRSSIHTHRVNYG